MSRNQARAHAAWLMLWPCVLSAACGAARHFPDQEGMARFLAAGPALPELDQDAILRQRAPTGPYRLGPGDIVELRGPRALFGADAAAGGEPFVACLLRVPDSGAIQAPTVGAVEAAGKTLLELEQDLADAAHPRFLVARPSVLARVVEHARQPVHVLGAVERPGIHELRRDQMTLFAALDAAGGILKSSNLVVGARRICVQRADGGGGETAILPVKGLNVPFADLALHPGDVVQVERYEPDTFTVIGLVARPGAYDYPPEVSYNLMQALATAGGVDVIADPPYATVFRRDDAGAIVPATFAIAGNGLAASSGLRIKPGDVIVVEHTAASWTRSLLGQILRVQFGFFVDSRAN